jgi:hypothetical protein
MEWRNRNKKGREINLENCKTIKKINQGFKKKTNNKERMSKGKMKIVFK